MDQPIPSLLKIPLFRNLWTTVEISFLGMFIHVVAAAWLMTGLTSSAMLVSLIQTAYSLPIVIFSVVAGALADTMDRRKTMIGSLLLSLVASAGLAGLSLLGLLTPWSLLGLIFLVGSGVAIFTPSWQASLGDISPRDRLMEAVSLHNIGANVMRTIGPSIGGVLVATVGAGVTFIAGAISYLPALIAMLIWYPSPLKTDGQPESIQAAVGLGFRFLRVSPQLQQLLLRVFCFSLSAVSVMALLPLIAKDQFGLGARSYGFLFGGFGLGAIGGGLAIPSLRRRYTIERIVQGAFLVNAVAIAILALSRGIGAGLPATVVAGSCWLIVHSIQNSTLQLATPRWIVGRMVAMFLSSAFLGLAVGGWLWGEIVEWIGTQGALGIAAVAMLATFALSVRVRLPDTAGLALESIEDMADTTRSDPNMGGGPLHVVIEHCIDTAKLSEFQQVMEQRRRHLIRLGARQWLLMRDIRDGSGWLETFKTAGWDDYRRIMSRRTSETAALRAGILALQQDGADPVVRLLIQEPSARPATESMLRT